MEEVFARFAEMPREREMVEVGRCLAGWAETLSVVFELGFMSSKNWIVLWENQVLVQLLREGFLLVNPTSRGEGTGDYVKMFHLFSDYQDM